MQFLKEFRNLFFKEMGKKRVYRILTCSFVIALIWCFADVVSGSFEPNLFHDFICLCLGIIAERLIPWGKNSVKGGRLH